MPNVPCIGNIFYRRFNVRTRFVFFIAGIVVWLFLYEQENNKSRLKAHKVSGKSLLMLMNKEFGVSCLGVRDGV